MKRTIFMRDYCVLIILCLMIRGHTLQSQQLVSFACGEVIHEKYSVDWSMGELLTLTLSADDVSVTQGYQQPSFSESCRGCFKSFAEDEVNSSTSILHFLTNPTSHILDFQYVSEFTGNVHYRVYSLVGRELASGYLYKDQVAIHQSLNVGHYKNGQYYLRVTNEKTSLTKPFLVVK